MKLSSIFNIIKTKLQAIEQLKLITWWNAQLPDNIIHTLPAVFIEFPDPLQTTQMSNIRMQNTQLTIRVLLISKLLSNNAGEIDLKLIEQHEKLAISVYDALQGIVKHFNSDNIAINSLVRKSIELNLQTPGMAITIQDFHCLAILNDANPKNPITPNINLLNH